MDKGFPYVKVMNFVYTYSTQHRTDGVLSLTLHDAHPGWNFVTSHERWERLEHALKLKFVLEG